MADENGPGAPASATEAGIRWCDDHLDTTERGRPPRRRNSTSLDHVEIAARAIYGAHWKRPSPTWEQTSANLREWVRVQARAAIAALRAAHGP
jgi:hypothetical protein